MNIKKKKCKGITLQNRRCTCDAVIGNYCIQHYWIEQGYTKNGYYRKQKKIPTKKIRI